jgi:CRISPR/Cas system CMR-associated protein Cmr3 (group 5 of RAMP superfamily)
LFRYIFLRAQKHPSIERLEYRVREHRTVPVVVDVAGHTSCKVRVDGLDDVVTLFFWIGWFAGIFCHHSVGWDFTSSSRKQTVTCSGSALYNHTGFFHVYHVLFVVTSPEFLGMGYSGLVDKTLGEFDLVIGWQYSVGGADSKCFSP